MEEAKRKRYEKAKLAYTEFMKVYPFTLKNLKGEEWADVAGYEGLYQVSTFGRVKSFTRWVKGRILRPALDTQGYLYIVLQKNKKCKPFLISRLVALNFIPNTENKPQVDHIDGVKLNNHISNLRWVTSFDNIKAAYKLGIRKSGVEHQDAKLTSKQVEFIRSNLTNLTQEKLATMFNVSRSAISHVKTGRTYPIG